MEITISPIEQQEFQDLLTISAVSDETKAVLQKQFDSNAIDSHTFFSLLYILREEDRLDREMQKYAAELANFDPVAYTQRLKEVVEGEIQKYLAAKAA